MNTLSRWRAWRNLSRNRRIFSAILSGGVASAAAGCAMIARDLLMARDFGASGSVDSYVIAYTLVMFAMSVLANSAGSALMPTYVHLRETRGEAAALTLAWRSGFALAGLMVCAAIVIAALATPLLALVASNFPQAERVTARHALFWMVGVLPAYGIAATLTVIANAQGKFARPALAPAFPPLFAAAALLYLHHPMGILALAAGTLLGAYLQLVLFLPEWRYIKKKQVTGIAVSDSWGQCVKQYWQVASGSVLNSAVPLINQALAAMLAAGAVATFSYGQKLVSLIVSVVALALANAVLPHFSEMIAERNWAGVWHTYRTYQRLVWVAVLPLTAILMVLSKPIVILIFQRGAFDASTSIVVANVQTALLLQLPFYLLIMLNIRLISALKANIILLYGAILSLMLTIILGYAFMLWLGVTGIGLSASIVFALTWLFLSFFARKLLHYAQTGQC